MSRPRRVRNRVTVRRTSPRTWSNSPSRVTGTTLDFGSSFAHSNASADELGGAESSQVSLASQSLSRSGTDTNSTEQTASIHSPTTRSGAAIGTNDTHIRASSGGSEQFSE